MSHKPCSKDGVQFKMVHRSTKGGKVRNIDIIGSDEEIALIKDMIQNAGEGLVFNRIHSAFDEHYFIYGANIVESFYIKEDDG